MATNVKEIKNRSFTLVRELVDTDKAPPQMKAIVTALKTFTGKAERRALIEALKKTGVLSTTQTPERIFGFYRPKLIEMGVMKEHVDVEHVEVEVKEPKAKAPKEAKTETAGAGAQHVDSKPHGSK